MNPHLTRCLPVLAGTLTFSATCLAQSSDDIRKLGSGYAHLLAVVAEPEIAIAKLDIDTGEEKDSTLKGAHLPIYREFELEGRDWHWYAQGSLGYATLTDENNIPLPESDPLIIDFEWTAYTGLAEVGLVFPLGHGFSFAPGLSVGLSRLENDADFSSKFLEDLLAPVADGILYNWSSNATLIRGHAALRYNQHYGKYRVKGGAHLTYSHVDSYSESSRFSGFTDHSAAAVLKLDVSRRINSEQAERPIRLIGHLGGTSFIGDSRDELGFSSFGEAGLSLGISQYSAGVLAVFGDSVDGISLTFNYNY